ncbi:MAG: GNAT family N-acetyltransferase [Deltaproteobacteria bacterium]|nr:GNAT family N-acetyltransferase [Candidatus Zymogenaceae bacterium]
MAEIHYLMDYPRYLPIVAFWNYREWHFGKGPFDEIITRYEQRLNKDKIPTTLIALEDTMPVGSVSIKNNDLIERPDLNPWLASLFVLSDYRGRDIGRRLLRAGEQSARAAGVGRLYLFTHTAAGLYEKEEWTFMESVVRTDGITEAIYYKDVS